MDDGSKLRLRPVGPHRATGHICALSAGTFPLEGPYAGRYGAPLVGRRLTSPEFIGRRQELGVLGAALRRAAAGEGCAVLVSGEAGVGSRILAKLDVRSRVEAAGVAHRLDLLEAPVSRSAR
jgi:hypothetical protein